MEFHISDVLSITTGRLVSSRHMEGIYKILNHMTGDNLFTHQLPRASRECEPVLVAAYPQLSKDDPITARCIAAMDRGIEMGERDNAVRGAVEKIRFEHGLPEMLEVPELFHGESAHTDPMDELVALVGKDKIIEV
jgi:hypothetical protein